MRPAASLTLTRRALAALALALVLTVGGAPAARAQETPTTVPPTSGVLVPGSTAPPTSAAPASTTTTEAPADDEGSGFLDLDANEKVWVIVGALVGVALLMLVLTILYWRHTKPDRVPAEQRSTTRAERKEQKRRRKATSKDPFVEDDDIASADEPSSGPMDLDDLLGSPDPSRSVFGSTDEDFDPGR